jgi:hypothetical protein
LAGLLDSRQIILLQECGAATSADAPPGSSDCKFIAPCAFSGVGALINARFYSMIEHVTLQHEFLILHAVVAEGPILMINVHLPDDGTLCKRGTSFCQTFSSA